LWVSERTVIGRVRVKSTGLDPLTTQQRTAGVLNTLSLHQAGLNPAAILCIRSLRDPKPGALRLRHDDVRTVLAWEQAVKRTIDHLARRAARPIDGVVPANAEAVIFADRSELLACLAMDWCAGEGWSHWWWQGLFRNTDTARAVLTAWLDAIAYAPAALHHLAVKRQAAIFVGRLTDDMADQLRQALVRTFGLPELHAALSEERREDMMKSSGPAVFVQPAPPEFKPLSPAPWRRWAPEADRGELRVEQRCLLGIGLMLQRVPSVVRAPGFARAVAEWHSTARIAGAVPAPDLEKPDTQRSTTAIRSATPSSADHAQRAAMPVAQTIAAPPEISKGNEFLQYAENTEALRHVPDGHTRTAGAQARAHSDPSWTDTPALGMRAAYEAPGETPLHHEPGGEQNAVALTPAFPAQVTTDSGAAAFDFNYEVNTYAAVVDDEIDTDLGGIFYLINLGLFLGLYGDFTTPLAPGIVLPIWDFITLVGQRLLGDAPARDPVWAMLAQLAGRTEDEPPGHHFEPPGHRTLDAWLDDLMTTIRPRLQLALGVKDDDLPRFFWQRAHVVVTAAHLDIFMSLDDLPIEIRLSGLDRDPGWVPAAGKFVAFHFDA
jgi:hypothetical protein